MTVQTFVNLALRDIGRLWPGQTPSSDESTEGLAVANEIIGSWSHEGLLVPTHAVTGFAMSALTTGYTFGVGGTWVTASLPIRVKGARSINGNFSAPCRVLPMGQFDQEAPVNGAGRTVVLPMLMGVDNSAPTRNVRVYPPPAGAVTTMEVSYWLALAPLVNLTDALAFAEPAFELALRNELSLRMARSFNVEVTPAMLTLAAGSKSALARINPGETVPQTSAPPQQQ